MYSQEVVDKNMQPERGGKVGFLFGKARSQPSQKRTKKLKASIVLFEELGDSGARVPQLVDVELEGEA